MFVLEANSASEKKITYLFSSTFFQRVSFQFPMERIVLAKNYMAIYHRARKMLMKFGRISFYW